MKVGVAVGTGVGVGVGTGGAMGGVIFCQEPSASMKNVLTSSSDVMVPTIWPASLMKDARLETLHMAGKRSVASLLPSRQTQAWDLATQPPDSK